MGATGENSIIHSALGQAHCAIVFSPAFARPDAGCIYGRQGDRTPSLTSLQLTVLLIIRLMIRPFSHRDAPQLAAIHNQVYTHSMTDPTSFKDDVADTLAEGGLAWVIGEKQLIGYALVSSIPGLPGLGDLSGCIIPERQRQGFGSRLLLAILDQLKETTFCQVVHRVGSLLSPAALFLRHHRFYIEHEEWQLSLRDLQNLPASLSAQPLALATYPRNKAASLFLEIHQESFSGLRWDQPYTGAEVKAALGDPNDILFLIDQDSPVGFAWVDIDQAGVAQIEPLGILPAYQRRGYGRYLLIATVHELKRRGARRVEIGAWRSNEPAITLYRSLGFRHEKTFTYLAFDIKNNSQ